RRLPRRVMPAVLGADPPVEAPAGPVELDRSGAVDPSDDPRVEGPERAPLTLGDRVAVTGGPVHAPRADPDVGRIENGLVRGGSHRGRRLGPRTRRPEGHDHRRVEVQYARLWCSTPPAWPRMRPRYASWAVAPSWHTACTSAQIGISTPYSAASSI